MAENETSAPAGEQIYTIPLREVKDYPRWKASNRAIKVIKEYLSRHMKVDEEKIRINQSLNEAIWANGIQHPPIKVRVKATRSDEGVIVADVIGSE